MASQNVPGIAVLRADGYATPSSPLIATTGLASLLLAPFGSHGVNLAAITAAICTGPKRTRITRSATRPPSGAAPSI
jgi:benzoate membrane transport protein